MPHISIIIPVYNTERYVANCIESLLLQTFVDWEAILVDDGSTDKSGYICDNYAKKDGRIKVFHKKNNGVSDARNFGLSQATGDFITFIDSDDSVQQTFLSNFSYDPTIDFEIQGFIINYIGHPERNRVVMPSETKVSSLYDIYAEAELSKLSRGPNCKLMKRDIIEENKILFPEGISFGEDAIFVKRYLLHCKNKARSISAADLLYNQYDNSNSLTHRKHPAVNIYKAALIDYQLYIKLEKKLGKMPENLDKDFKHIRTLEFYLSIVSCIRDKKMTYSQQREFIYEAYHGMYQEIKHQGCLPPSYRIVKFCLDCLPLKSVPAILHMIFYFKKDR